MNQPQINSTFRPVPRTGVIFVNVEAGRLGYKSGASDWCNLGQGQPETGPLPGAPPRVESLKIEEGDHDYAPVPGLWELREAVAHHYNTLYRKGLPSQYTAENVAISGGGRASLTRAAAAIGHINLGHFIPDYTAYEELLEIFRNFTSIPILLDASSAYHFSADDLEREILGRGLGAVLLSNPCNPTGKVIHGEVLDGWVEKARSLDCTLLVDEFYSSYIWSGEEGPSHTVSAARHVEDVNKDPVVIFDGLTKNWRYPGWRVTWTVGPTSVIEAVSSAGSFLDGGGTRPLQRAAVELLQPEYVGKEIAAIQESFRPKRLMMMDALERMGVRMDFSPEGTFYVWGNLEELPEGLKNGMDLFKAALKKKVIVVPGEFFDVNPGKRRPGRSSRFNSYVRFSFGPNQEAIEEGLARLAALIEEQK